MALIRGDEVDYFATSGAKPLNERRTIAMLMPKDWRVNGVSSGIFEVVETRYWR
jgi:hypothetical protein